MHRSVPTLRVQVIRLTCEVIAPISWNSFPGSVVHGNLGRVLRPLVCVRPGVECPDCDLRSKCAYGYAFAGARPGEGDWMKKYNHVPAPYRLSIHPWKLDHSSPGNTFDLELCLFGEGTNYATMFVLALDRILDDGIGRNNSNGRRGRARIVAVTDVLFKKRWAITNAHYPALTGNIRRVKLVPPSDNAAQSMVMHTLTPLRIVVDGKVNAAPDFRAVMATLLRRLSNLMFFHENLTLDWDFEDILKSAAAINASTQWNRVAMERYSARQKQSMRMDGVVGRMTLPTEAAPFIPLLKLGALTGVGKNTSFGYGLYKMMPKEVSSQDQSYSKEHSTA